MYDLSTLLAVCAYCSYVSLVGNRKPVRCSFYQRIRVPPGKVLKYNTVISNQVIRAARKLMHEHTWRYHLLSFI